ncbi:uncharacterized protein OCT59_018725 [Rhizophagus irregularis]|uniref:uncharacterized protein n=1 Tax=Rhizophagus irregularis TaxID=588596 RepID=UPI003318DBA8|nr:hypothetical protein OCT59_018725 [Rhizophagus irregularis]
MDWSMVSFEVGLPLQADGSGFPPWNFIGWADFPLRTLLDGFPLSIWGFPLRTLLDGRVSIKELVIFPFGLYWIGFPFGFY